MHINRQSYEEYFLLYADGELNESEKKAVEEFIDQNPDLAGEMSLIQETIFKPDGSIVFENREVLFKDEPGERNVIYMRWFRIAAAAVVLIAFSVTGWIFIGDKNIDKVSPAIVKNQEVKKNQPKDAVTAEKVEDTRVKRQVIAKKETQKQNIRLNIQPESKNISKEIVSEPGIENTASESIEKAAVRQGVVLNEPGKETIDVAVAPRAIDSRNEPQPPTDVAYAQQSFKQEEPNDDMIYFANTSLTKKTKLRGVLRKATRYLDRVTSLQ